MPMNGMPFKLNDVQKRMMENITTALDAEKRGHKLRFYYLKPRRGIGGGDYLCENCGGSFFYNSEKMKARCTNKR